MSLVSDPGVKRANQNHSTSSAVANFTAGSQQSGKICKYIHREITEVRTKMNMLHLKVYPAILSTKSLQTVLEYLMLLNILMVQTTRYWCLQVFNPETNLHKHKAMFRLLSHFKIGTHIALKISI